MPDFGKAALSQIAANNWSDKPMTSYRTANAISTYKRIDFAGAIIDTAFTCDVLSTQVTSGTKIKLIKDLVYHDVNTWSLYAFYKDANLTQVVQVVVNSTPLSTFNSDLTVPSAANYIGITYLSNAGLESFPRVQIPQSSAIGAIQAGLDSLTTLKGKNLAVLGDSIMMLQRSSVPANQTQLDNQDWASLKTALGLNDLMNLGLGGATVYDKGDFDTDLPQPELNTGYLTNEVRWLLRQVNTNLRPTPDCIVIWLGTNGAGEPTVDNYSTVMALSYTDLMSAANKSIRNTFYGGLRASLELIYNNFPYATVFIFSPIQTNPTNARTYDKLTVTRDALKRMADRYACVFVDALHEIGIVDFYENELNNGTSRFLGDGLHPNAKGKVVYKNYTSRRLNNLFFAKQ